MSEHAKLTFPKIQRVRLHNFSLYALQPNIDLKISNGVFCLAGANGLGKSTFLAALNFGITGIIPERDREFKGINEYPRYSRFNNEFFSGRITEDDRETAAITVELLVGDHLYELTRNIFELEQLRRLIITDVRSKEIIYDEEKIDDDSEEKAATQRQQEYQKRITKDIGLKFFRQFVFLQYFVFTFDESRHLLLWDRNVLTLALYIGIGADYSTAEKADKLRCEMERSDSRARNRGYAASNVRKQIQMLRDAMKSTNSNEEEDIDLEELRRQHQFLTEELMRSQEEIERKRGQLDDAYLTWTQISSELASLEAEYSRVFTERIQSHTHVEFHPTVSASLAEKRCAVCGAENEKAIQKIQIKLDDGACPLCDSKLSKKTTDADSLALLQKIDVQLDAVKKRMNTAIKARERITASLRTAEDKMEAKRTELKAFAAENEKILLELGRESGIQSTLENLNEELAELLRQKKAEYEKRNETQKELLKLQRELQSKYLDAEAEFVPVFQNLAFLFLGMELEIRMDAITSAAKSGLSLILEMRGQTRREIHQLSESQRFFLDIALRMALAQYMSHEHGKACLFIDTPEGSLDVTYESRAGKMFARFAENGHHLIMTANLNSSQILLRLAEDCGREKMMLQRMISWTELSDVQIEGEALFDKAYAHIEEALDSHGSGGTVEKAV